MAVACCRRCGEAVLDREGMMLVTVGRPDGRGGRRLVVCRECAERLISYLTGRPAPAAAGMRSP
jgi:hypothetical protein